MKRKLGVDKGAEMWYIGAAWEMSARALQSGSRMIKPPGFSLGGRDLLHPLKVHFVSAAESAAA